MPAATVPVTIRLPVAVHERLERLAAATSRNKAGLLAEAIDVFIQSEEQIVAAIETGRAAARAGETIAHDPVRRWLDSWGRDNEEPPPGAG